MFVNMATGGASSYSSCSASLLGSQDNVQQSPENAVLECRLCVEVFRCQGDKVPRLLFCGHTLCHQCLTRLTLHGRAILCPFDRQPTEIGDSGVWGLKKNFALLELLEKLQYSKKMPLKIFSEAALAKEKELAIVCDENELHTAVLYCTTCCTHLCIECSEITHATRTLARHKRVALSEKPRENPKCSYHPMHLVEFACLEDECKMSPLMCYICKDYGRHVRHKHALLEMEAESVRNSIISAVQHIKSFGEEVSESAHKMASVIQQIEGGVTVVQSDGFTSTQQVPGTAEQARSKIKEYFNELRQNLNCQELAALTTVDTHIREKLCILRQQQEDMAILLGQVSSVCLQCEVTLQQDDTKVVLAKNEVNSLLDAIQKQQQQFSELPDQLPLDPTIPITFTRDNRVHIGPKMEMRVVTLGLDDAGKTSILFKLKQNEFIQTIPTIGFNVETVEYKNLKFTIWDVGGQHKIRPLWKHYYFNTQAVIYVVDSSNKDRLQEAYNELAKLVQEKELREASLLIFANKQDIESCASIEEITEQFSLFKLCCNRSWHIQACDAKSGYGLHDGLEWLSRQMVATGSPEFI
ncbi:E3 ubiquitin-protein ligase TRIM23 [Octopus bimaculoides]|uniref:RING-type E3 ubiquitin transferase n=1 Tax=Octopus bimaculoides TaxID=37653 RepID=A0A0L8G5S0_OCTBM|nr:E3 ubiquitin-protein ligase TRIM23 [Octopus bimaculoides]|eukprot:XP_014784130.1 PREDICTED: E3 ubiquitin-protein ligase TRIM23-like [Octopus bimaculoides]